MEKQEQMSYKTLLILDYGYTVVCKHGTKITKKHGQKTIRAIAR